MKYLTPGLEGWLHNENADPSFDNGVCQCHGHGSGMLTASHPISGWGRKQISSSVA